MFDPKRQIVGTEEFNVPITSVNISREFINLNNGCIIAYKINKDDMEFFYDKLNGPKVKSDRLYVWNSTQKTKTGKPKKEFCVSRQDLKEVVWWALDLAFGVISSN